MTRARELANFADDTAGLETLTVSDITDLTATATELNKLDGVTATTSELNVTDGVTVSTANINSAVNQITDSSTDLNVDSNTLVVDKSANAVGIGGQTTPLAKLDIKGNTNTYDGMAKIYLTDNNSNSASRNWSLGNGGSGHGNLTFAVSASKDGVAGDATATNAMVITSSGNVGIGVNNPTNTYGPVLHIAGGNPNLRLDGSGSGSWAWISMNTADAGDSRAMGTASDGSFRITNVRDSLDSGIQFRIEQNGKVGIGAGPSYQLHTLLGAGESNGVGFLNANGQGLNFYTDTTASNADVFIDQGASGAAIIFKQAGTERMRIQSDGDVVPGSSSQDLGEGANKWANIHISRGTNFGTHNGKAYCWRLNQNTMVQGSGSRQYDILQPGQGYGTYQGWSASSMLLYDEYGNAGGNATNPSSSDWITFANNRIALNANGEHGSLYHFYGYVNWYTYGWTSNGYISVIDDAGNNIYVFEGGTDTHNSGWAGSFSFLVDFDSMVNIRFYNNYRRGTYSSVSGGHLNIRRIN